MALFTMRLESQTDSQWRQLNVDAPNEKTARAIAARKEAEYVDFSLLPSEPVAPEEPDSDDAEVLVQYANARDAYASEVGSYESAYEAGSAALAKLEEDHTLDEDGKAHGQTKFGRAHLHLHYQSQPYLVKSVEPIIPSTAELVRAALALQEYPDQWEKALADMRDLGIPLAAVTAALYGVPWQKQIDGSAVTVWSSATIQTSLHTAYTLNQDTHDFFDDVSGTEVTGTNYTANGVTLGSKTSAYDTASDQIRLDAADASWATSTISATDAIVWVNTAGASSTDPVLGAVDFGATVSTTAGTFLITWDATGIIVYDVT